MIPSWICWNCLKASYELPFDYLSDEMRRDFNYPPQWLINLRNTIPFYLRG